MKYFLQFPGIYFDTVFLQVLILQTSLQPGEVSI